MINLQPCRLVKTANIETEAISTAAEMKELVKSLWAHPAGKAAILGLAGAGAVGAAALPAYNVVANREGIRHGDEMEDSFLTRHPYASGLGVALASSGAAGLAAAGTNMIAPGAGFLPAIPIHVAGDIGRNAIGTALANRVEGGDEDVGLLGNYTKRNPIMGSAVSQFIPGLDINAHIGGEEMARQSMKEHGFIARNPYTAAYLSALAPIPGYHKAVTHAVARILNEKEKARV